MTAVIDFLDGDGDLCIINLKFLFTCGVLIKKAVKWVVLFMK